MKIVIASDSFKGSLSSLEVAHHIKKGIHQIFDDADIDIATMADGGEGTVEAILDSMGGEIITTEVLNPLNESIMASYAILDDGSALIEMASASGLPLIKDKDIMKSHTYGTGQLILDALNHNCQHIYIGIGGSATNDGGLGMAKALGVKFLDVNNQELDPTLMSLPLIHKIDMSHLDSRLDKTTITVMCDVTNPLCGENGASAIYGPQKGATPQDIQFLDTGLNNLAKICQESGLGDYRDIPGAGAAGGLGFALMTFLNAKLQSGIETTIHITQLEKKIAQADLVITGEGRIDNQSIYGKVPVGVAKVARAYNIPCVAIVGSIGDQVDEVYHYIGAIESCVDQPCDLETALKNASINVENASMRLMRAMKVGRSLR